MFSTNIYEDLVESLAAVIVLHGAQEFEHIEQLLFKKLIGDCVWSSLLSLDVWLLVLR